MDRNTTTAFILIGAILVIWLFINTPEQTEKPTSDQDSTIVIDRKQEDTLRVIEEEKTQTPVLPKQKEENLYGTFSATVTDSGRIITVETDLAIYELSTR